MKKYIDWTWLILLLIFPFVLWALPANFFDQTGFELCPSKLFFDIECFGCGMTRAVMHLHHFELEEAIYYNYGVAIVYPALVVVWFLWTKKAAQNLGLWKIGKKEQHAV